MGITTVMCAAVDTSGNSVACSFSVTVQDQEAPILACPQLPPIAFSANANATIVNYVLYITDNAGSRGLVQACAPASGSLFGLGATLTNCSATDLSGNTGYCSFYVRTIDITPPTITCPSSMAISTDPGVPTAVYSFPLPTATDNVRAYPPTRDTPSQYAVPTVVTCTTTDTSGNRAACIFT